jgi:hypothetical protein
VVTTLLDKKGRFLIFELPWLPARRPYIEGLAARRVPDIREIVKSGAILTFRQIRGKLQEISPIFAANFPGTCSRHLVVFSLDREAHGGRQTDRRSD